MTSGAATAAWAKQAIGRLVRDSVLQLVKANQLFEGQVEIDGLICITGRAEGQEIVVKVHERVGHQGRLALTDFLARPRDGYSLAAREDDSSAAAEDYSLKRPRMEDSRPEADSYPNLKQQLMNPSPGQSLRAMADREASREDTPAAAKDLSQSIGALDMSSTAEEDQTYTEGSLSPKGEDSNISPPSGSFRYPYTSTPHNSMFPRRIPIRTDRWSPNMPLPSTPECKPCGYNFPSFDARSEHNEAVHSVFTCQSCYKTFTSRSNLERHSRLHTGHRPYSCTICGKAFSRKDHLSNHATKHAFKCGTCSKRFTDKKMLVSHYSYDHNAILTNICAYCNKGFSSAEQYEEHLKVHPQYTGEDGPLSPMADDDDPASPEMDNMLLECSVCPFTTADRLTLLKHQLIHQDSARCYTCLSCAKMFVDPLRYSDHLHVHSSESNIFECCLCRHISPTLSALRRHEASHINNPLLGEEEDEEDEDPAAYPCPKCDDSFASPYILEEHLEVHGTTDGSFVCGVCKQEFDNYSAICSHIEQEGHYASYSPSEAGMEPEGRNKRKQKLPKAVKRVEGLESDVEIVEPESPDEGGNKEEDMDTVSAAPASMAVAIPENLSNGKFLEPTPMQAVEDGRESPMGLPVKRLLSQAIRTRKEKSEPIGTMSAMGALSVVGELLTRRESPRKALAPGELPPSGLPAPSPHKHPSPAKGAEGGATASTPNGKLGEANNNSSSSNNNVLLSPKLSNVEIPAGPFTCSICSNTILNFTDLEMHCFSEHNRSPCMFCSKTFAQKANRDRHVCLHTGERPYACPDCDEKFSRGDKLKIHRMRVHQTAFPALSARGGGARDLSGSPEDDSPGQSQDPMDDWGGPGAPSDNMYAAGEWAPHAEQQSYLPVGGEWSVKQEGAEGSVEEPAAVNC